MDITTLAAARAYTDKKVAEGGGSGGGGLPVVELTTSPPTEMTPLTAEECALMDEMAAKKMPFLLKWTSSYSGMVWCSLASVMSPPDDSTFCFVVDTLMETVMINKDEVWQVMSINKD